MRDGLLSGPGSRAPTTMSSLSSEGGDVGRKLHAIRTRIAFFNQHLPTAVTSGYSEPGVVADAELQEAFGGPHVRLPLYIRPSDFIDIFGRPLRKNLEEPNSTEGKKEVTAALGQESRVVLEETEDSEARPASDSQDVKTFLRIKAFMQRRVAERAVLAKQLAAKTAELDSVWRLRCRKREAEWGEPEDLGKPPQTPPATPSVSNTASVTASASTSTGLAKSWKDALAQFIPDQYASLPMSMFPWPRFIQAYPSASSHRDDLSLANSTVWSPSERKVFIETYLQYPKNFARIAAALPWKTCEQCVKFYYEHKKEYRLKQMVASYRRAMVAQRKIILSANAAAAVSGPNANVSADSNADAVSIGIASNRADSPSESTQKGTGKTGRPVGRPKTRRE